MNAIDVTGPCVAAQDGLIMLACGSRKMEFRLDGEPIGRNAELRRVRFGLVIGKPKSNRPTVFRRPLVDHFAGIPSWYVNQPPRLTQPGHLPWVCTMSRGDGLHHC